MVVFATTIPSSGKTSTSAGEYVETKKVVIIMLGDEYVRENCKNVGGIIEENESYKMKYLMGKMAMDVIDKYVGFSDSGFCAQEESRISPRRESYPIDTHEVGRSTRSSPELRRTRLRYRG